jgi:hypothetical protein
MMIGLTIKYMPHSIVQEASNTEFVMDIPFKEVQKAVRKGQFEQETLRINNAELVSKQWSHKHLDIQRPLKKDRYIEFSGRLFAKVRVDNQHAGKIEVELVEDVCFATDRIEVKTTLARPLAIGVSDMRQEILMTPQGDKTYVRLSSNITLKRYIPFFMAEYARKQVKTATVDSVQKMEYVIRNLGKQNEI